jgi:hypothetical protein
MDFETILKIVRSNCKTGDAYAISAEIVKAIHESKEQARSGKANVAITIKRGRRTKAEMAAASTANTPIQLHQDAAE